MVVPGFSAPAGSSFLILDNRSAASITGTFSGMPQGSRFGVEGLTFEISYQGGDGNDVVLTRVANPAASNVVAVVSAGQMVIQAQGFASVTYILQAAPHLNAPIPWQPIATNVANASGLLQFADADLPLHTQRFYRIASP